MRNGNYELIIPPEEYPGKRYRGKYAYEHRVNWWIATGLNPDDFPNCVIHHKDDEKRNNGAENLEIKSSSEHTALHNQMRCSGKLKLTCLHCGIEFERIPSRKQKFCSRRCIGLYNYPKRSMGKIE